MKLRVLVLGAATIASLAIPFSTFAQGSLTPPGAPQPGMKTLQQIEPRTPISSLPFTITNSGSYYLEGNLVGASGQNGINVLTNDVTIDLSGFSLSGVSGSLNGMQIASGARNVTVLNGTIANWGSAGISAAGAAACRFEQLRILANASGLSCGSNALVAGCTILNHSGDGLVVGAGSFVRGNSLANNGASATASAIRVSGSGSRIEANHATGGTGFGFRIESAGNLIVRNSASGSGAAAYSIVSGNDFGQILSPGANFTNDVPWANFGSGGGSVCGNGAIEVGETCDDGNLVNGDGCTSMCAIQNGYTCAGSPSVCNTVCGDGIVAGSEQCDDNNTSDGDGCSSACQIEPCVTASQCPGTDTECQTRTCTAGVCGFSFTATGTVVANQNAGDCQLNVCDGNGNVVATPDNNDLPADDSNQCTQEVCVNGIPAYQPRPVNSPCNENGGVVCDGNSACVQCTSASQCPGSDTGCQPRACINNSCGTTFAAAGTACGSASCVGSTLTQASTCDGTGSCVSGALVSCSPYTCANSIACGTSCSSDANCVSTHFCNGGTCVPKQANGGVCLLNNQCQSGFCVDGVCCNTACNGTCQACSAFKKGSGSDGVCGNIAANTDPDNECTGGNGVCNGSGACF